MNIVKRKRHQTEYFNPCDTASSESFAARLSASIRTHKCTAHDTIILCIGTDRATGDALGPIVGSLLAGTSCSYTVYGTLKNPVHALNLREYIQRIYQSHCKPFVIAVDASLGGPSDVGMITFSHAPLYPGIGVNKKLPAIGDVSITGIVNLSGKPGLSLLQSTRLYTVHNMAQFISGAILASESMCFD